MKNSKSLPVFQFLLKELEKLSPGDKLPSNLTIQKICGVSQGVVTRAIDELKNRNLVEVRPKSGFYKKQSSKSTVHIVYMRENDQSLADYTSFYSVHLMALFQNLSANGYSVRYHHLANLDEIKDIVSANYIPNLSSEVIITFSMPTTQIKNAEELEKEGFKFIHWLPDISEPYKNSLTINDEELISTQIEYLFNKGHRRIAYAHRCIDGSWIRSANLRYDAFCRQSIKYRLDIYPDYLFYLDARHTKQEKLNDSIAKLFSNKDESPTAIIIVDIDAKMLYKALKTNNIKIGPELSVLGTDNHLSCSFLEPALSGVGFNLKAATTRLLEILDNNHWDNPAWYFPLELQEFESVYTNKK